MFSLYWHDMDAVKNKIGKGIGMNGIESMNQELSVEEEEIKEMIIELTEREEFACTAKGCGGHACGIN